MITKIINSMERNPAARIILRYGSCIGGGVWGFISSLQGYSLLTLTSWIGLVMVIAAFLCGYYEDITSQEDIPAAVISPMITLACVGYFGIRFNSNEVLITTALLCSICSFLSGYEKGRKYENTFER